jgi:hypothetical protein
MQGATTRTKRATARENASVRSARRRPRARHSAVSDAPSSKGRRHPTPGEGTPACKDNRSAKKVIEVRDMKTRKLQCRGLLRRWHKQRRAHVRACVCVRVRARARACVCVCARARARVCVCVWCVRARQSGACHSRRQIDRKIRRQNQTRKSSQLFSARTKSESPTLLTHHQSHQSHRRGHRRCCLC